MTVTAYIALGSNLGDRRATLDEAVRLLGQEPGVRVLRVSPHHETEPVGGPAGQGRYLNAAAEVETTLGPGDLLAVLLGIEARLGRVRGEKDAPRTLDLDLLLYGDRVLREPAGMPPLEVPHPRMHERTFVLRPLANLAPHAVHPVLGSTVLDLLRRSEGGAASGPRELAGLRAVVTGSTSGIGRAIARAFATGGADVVVHGRRSAAAEAVAEELRRGGVRSHALLADVRVADDCARLVLEAWELWGGVEVWVNNAGADTLTGAAARWPFERKLQALWAVDVVGTMLLSRDVGSRMREARGGLILNMGWDQAETGMDGDSGQLFGAVKGAVMAFSRSLAATLAPEVRVNCLAPGWIRTAWGEGAPQQWQERVLRETPLRRWGLPEDVAAVARWLASPAAAYLTGQIVRVNGGAIR